MIFTSYYFVNEGYAQTREEVTADSKKIIKTNPELRSSSLEKIDKKIIEWQTSSNQEAYARDNNLIFSNDKIQVYVYLDSVESITDIPHDIEVTDSDANIAVAFVNLEQINQLSQMDFVVQISLPITAVPRETEREPTKITTKLNDPKIDSIILEWINSSNQEAYARDNNLIFSNDKIQVYVYLDSVESITDIPHDIEVTDSDANIAVAFVNLEQINQLSQMDFVVQISPPLLATTPPIPIIQENDNEDSLDLIGLGGVGIIIAIITGVIYSKKRKGNRS